MGYDIKWGVCEQVWVSRWDADARGCDAAPETQSGPPAAAASSTLELRAGPAPPGPQARGIINESVPASDSESGSVPGPSDSEHSIISPNRPTL